MIKLITTDASNKIKEVKEINNRYVIVLDEKDVRSVNTDLSKLWSYRLFIITSDEVITKDDALNKLKEVKDEVLEEISSGACIY